MDSNTINADNCVTPNRGWLDKVAIMMAVVCGIHCLVTPVLLVALPILGTTFWANGDFHLWMFALVVPTTLLAVFSGCRKHKDRMVALFAATGLLILGSATAMESFAGHGETGDLAMAAECAEAACCAVEPIHDGESGASLVWASLSTEALLNLTGGLFLIAGHIRNFRLCRSRQCCDGLSGVA